MCITGTAHLEKVYENALVHRLQKLGLDVKRQHPLSVLDEDGTPIGEYYADLLVNGGLLVELKAVRALANEHTAQLLGYMKSARMEDGLLINFGSYKFQIQKYILSREIRRSSQGPSAFFLSPFFALSAFLCGR